MGVEKGHFYILGEIKGTRYLTTQVVRFKVHSSALRLRSGSRACRGRFNPDFIGKQLSMPRVLNRLMKNPHLTVNGSANNH